jgi:hypothetical protein
MINDFSTLTDPNIRTCLYAEDNASCMEIGRKSEIPVAPKLQETMDLNISKWCKNGALLLKL